MDIGRANLYEQVGRQAGLRIQVVIAGACNAEQSTFIYGDVCVSRHVRLFTIFTCFHTGCIEAGIECIEVFGIQLFLYTSKCFPEALEVYNFTGAEETDGVCNLRNIADYAQYIIVGRTCFLLCCDCVKTTWMSKKRILRCAAYRRLIKEL